MLSPVRYQPHIDGLRAVAVLSVVFYHFGLPGFTGGYVGVDVFFVISGYLITRLILDEIDRTGRFGFRRFYARRVRRLLPALVAVLSMSTVVAACLLSSAQFAKFGATLAATILSVSNVQLWTESGYFAADATLNPLLHTWSLSVEEQFYLCWPALLWLVFARLNQRRRAGGLILLAAASLALNHLWVAAQFDTKYAATIFYLTPFRIFELTIGALAIYMAPPSRSKRWLHELGMMLGLGLIGYSVISYTDELVFPYYRALLPCLGALLVILSHRSRIAGWLLTNPVSIGIGLISYSMYLAHWPALVFLRYYEMGDLSTAGYLWLFAIVCALSGLLYRFVETPFRRPPEPSTHQSPSRAFALVSVILVAALATLGVQIEASDGWSWRQRGGLTAADIRAGKSRRLEQVGAGCTLDRLSRPKFCKMDRSKQILVLGNSHEADGFNAFSRVYADHPEVNLISFGTTNFCGIVFKNGAATANPLRRKCRRRVAVLNDAEFASSLDGVVYSSRRPFDANKAEIWKVIRHLQINHGNLPVVVLGDFISTTFDCSALINRFNNTDACKAPQFLSHNPKDERDVSAREVTRDAEYAYIDTFSLLCPDGTLESCTMEANGEPAFYDSYHLSLGYASYLGDRIRELYGDELVQAGFPRP